ncbi:hypothetical protein HPG69_004949 [Diceros bicornis minor]|uniref:Ribosomal protein S4 n=1 Tax=Diceros bicornis minor TaxID=77932 RepID=A0A7J7E508_DICBM|nr:hypothetical protein HPG69_004949 [Diceros bicornis minor]
MDVISIDKTGENFHLICVTKGCFAVHHITPEEAKYTLCKEPLIWWTRDAHTIRYTDSLIKVNDTIQIDLETGKITDFIKFDTGNLCIVTRGVNLGKIGMITNRERHPGSFDVVHRKDANGNSFASWLSNIFVFGKGNKPWISLAHGKGSTSPLLKRETKDWQPNRAVSEMISSCVDKEKTKSFPVVLIQILRLSSIKEDELKLYKFVHVPMTFSVLGLFAQIH